MANTTNRTTRIKHVFGNVLKLAIPLTLRTVTLEGGIVEVTDTDYTPSNHYPVVVQFVNGPLKYELDATIRDNYIAVVEDKGTIPVGNYAIVVLCKDDNGDPRRFKQRCVLEVVDVTADAGIEVGIEFEAQEWLLDGAIFLAVKGEDGIDGVGIESITTDETSVSGEYNQVTFHLTNGSSYTLNVRNGESTEQTLPANVVVDENYVHTDNNYTDTDKQKVESVDKLFADAEYDRISRRLNFFKHGDTMHTNPLKSIDITDFIRDSRVSSFRIIDGNLTIKLNSDGNNEEFKVPITSINANYYTKSQVDSLYSSLSSRVTPVEVIFTESNDSITSNRTINGIYTDYTNKKPIIGKYGSSVGVLLYISSQEAAFLFGDRYDKPFILRNSGSTHWGKEDLVDDSSSIVIDDAPTPESDNAVSSGSVWYYLTQRIQSVTINGTTKTPDDNGNVNFTVQGGGGYTPPQGGIPKTDLASGVQSSLDAADSAYQKPNGGIPASDLSSAVQTSLGKADTALQSSDLEGYATTDDVDDAVAALVSSAPQTLDTLNELAEALGDDPNFATTMATQLGNKVDKETGKGLSTNDYTTAEKTKLAELENYDDSALQTAIDGMVANAGKVKSVTINGQKKLPNAETGDVDLGTVQGETGPQGLTGNCNINDASQLITILVNNFTTGGAGNIASAETVKILRQNVDRVQANIQTLLNAIADFAFPQDKPQLTELDWNVPKNTVTINGVSNTVITRNGEAVSGSILVDYGTELTLLISPEQGYAITSLTADNGVLTDNGNGTYTLVITVTSNVTITFTGAASAAYSITYNLTNIQSASRPVSIISGGTASIALQPTSGYALTTNEITVVGATVVSYADNVLTISNPTGDVTVTAVAYGATNTAFKNVRYVIGAGDSVGVEFGQQTDYITSPLIDVGGVGNIQFNCGASVNKTIGLFLFDANGNYIDYFMYNAVDRSVNISSLNVSYVRISVATSSLSSAYIKNAGTGEYLWQGSSIADASALPDHAAFEASPYCLQPNSNGDFIGMCYIGNANGKAIANPSKAFGLNYTHSYSMSKRVLLPSGNNSIRFGTTGGSGDRNSYLALYKSVGGAKDDYFDNQSANPRTQTINGDTYVECQLIFKTANYANATIYDNTHSTALWEPLNND